MPLEPYRFKTYLHNAVAIVGCCKKQDQSCSLGHGGGRAVLNKVAPVGQAECQKICHIAEKAHPSNSQGHFLRPRRWFFGA